VENVARELARRDEAPLAIVTSPLVRARETAEIVARAIPSASLEMRRELAMGGASGDVVTELVSIGRDRALLVGHQPDLSGLVADLTGLSVEMKKGMVVGLEIKDEIQNQSHTRHGTAKGRRRRFGVRFVLDPHTLKDVAPGRVL